MWFEFCALEQSFQPHGDCSSSGKQIMSLEEHCTSDVSHYDHTTLSATPADCTVYCRAQSYDWDIMRTS